MFTLYKRQEAWWLRGTAGGVYYRQSTGTDNRAEAEVYATRFYQEIIDRAIYGVKRTATFADAVELYIKGGGETRFLMPLLDLFGAKRIAELTPIEIANGASMYQHLKPATIARQYYDPLRAVLNRAVEADLADPIKVRAPKWRKEKPQPASDDYLERFLRNANPRLRALVLFITCTGARISEAVRLEDGHIDWPNKQATIWKTKNGEARTVALANPVIRALADIPGNKDETQRVFGFSNRHSAIQAVRRHAESQGLEYIRPHRMGRHAFAARLLKAGHSLKLVQDAGGWKTIRMVAENYGHLEKQHVDDAVRGASTNLVQKKEKPSRKPAKPGTSKAS